MSDSGTAHGPWWGGGCGRVMRSRMIPSQTLGSQYMKNRSDSTRHKRSEDYVWWSKTLVDDT